MPASRQAAGHRTMRILHVLTGATVALLAGGAVVAAFAGEPTNYNYNPPVEYQILGGGERSPATGFPAMNTSPKNGVDGSHLGPQANSYGKNGVDGSHQGALTSASHSAGAVSSAFSGAAGHAHGMGHGGGGAK